SAGYCLRQSNERSERAAIKNNHIKNYFYQLHRFTPTKLETNQKKRGARGSKVTTERYDTPIGKDLEYPT
ncbi:MAG: hypothetical protein ABF291_16955, partial [Desulfobacterales bacterium]